VGITGIKQLINNFSQQITMTDLENSSLAPVVVGPTRSGGNSQVTTTSQQPCDMWVPWCTSQSDYDKGHHYISLEVPGVATYSIWQAAQSDGDFVRYSTGGYQNPGNHLSYASRVNGNQDRCIFVNSSGQPSIWPYGAGAYIPYSIAGVYMGIPSDLMQKHMMWHVNPPDMGGRQFQPAGSPGSGLEFLTFHRDFLAQVFNWYFAQPFADADLVAAWNALPEPLQQYQLSAGPFNDIQAFMANPFSQGTGTSTQNKTEDDLGIWLEAGIHNTFLHPGLASVFNNASVTNLRDPSIPMSPSTTYFYQLHGLISYWWNYWRSFKASKDAKDVKEKDKEKEKEKDKDKDKDLKEARDGTNISSQASMMEVLGAPVESPAIDEQAASAETFISSAERPSVGAHALEDE